MDKTTKGFVIAASVVVIGFGALYLKQRRDVAWKFCYRIFDMTGSVSLTRLVDDKTYKNEFYKRMNACANENMFQRNIADPMANF